VNPDRQGGHACLLGSDPPRTRPVVRLRSPNDLICGLAAPQFLCVGSGKRTSLPTGPRPSRGGNGLKAVRSSGWTQESSTDPSGGAPLPRGTGRTGGERPPRRFSMISGGRGGEARPAPQVPGASGGASPTIPLTISRISPVAACRPSAFLEKISFPST